MKRMLPVGLIAAACALPALTQSDPVVQAEDQQEILLHKFPALRLIDQRIREDCATKQRKSPKGNFCHCAAAVTMTLWFSGMDPKMAPRLQAFIDHPTDGSEFLAYQGPELYTPLCRHA